MTLVGIKFVGSESSFFCRKFRDQVMDNADKPVVKLLFDVKAYCIESDILVINKEFLATKTVNMLYLVMVLGSAVAWFVWNVWTPLFIVAGLIFVWGLFQTPVFNFMLFKLMIRRAGYKGKVVML